MTAPFEKDLSLKIDRARFWLLREQPFYGQLCFGLKDVPSESARTAETDGRRIFWNPNFLRALRDEETRFVLMHEVLHSAQGHMWRLPANLVANIACDFVINHLLDGIGGVAMPAGALRCPVYFRDLAEEEIYRKLLENATVVRPPGEGKNGKPEDWSGVDACGVFLKPADDEKAGSGDGDEKSESGSKSGDGEPAQRESLRETWEKRVIQAAHAASLSKGSTPAWATRLLDRVLATKVDWRRETADFVRDAASHRNDWSRCSRRHAWQKVIYPRRHVDSLGLVLFARDTSGSVSDDECAAYTALISQCLAETGCRGIVLDCDCEIHAEHWLNPGDECPLVAEGGGGTSHLPVWQRATELAEQGERIAGIVCLTDMRTDFPENDGGFASLWLATTDEVSPFGRTVRA